jgi:biopolymer transport protein ExbD
MESDFQLVPQEFEKPEINLAPFVDTIMILLIFFVVTANLYVETGIDVSKPKAQSAHTMGQKAILIGLTREGTVHIYGRQVTLDKVRMLIQREAARQADLSVVIVADRDASVGKAVEVMDQCALGGAPRVSIAAGKD